jgi:hypothetical protein
VKTILEVWTFYKPLIYHTLHMGLLKQSKVDVSKNVSKKMWNSMHKYGTKICYNGWNNVSRRPFWTICFLFLLRMYF